MIVLDRGHRYALKTIDAAYNADENIISFVKRIGEKYPGNIGLPYSGTTTQEVLRVLIDRTKYVNQQIPDSRNIKAISLMREVIRLFEERAAERHGCDLKVFFSENIEEIPVDPINGHLTSRWDTIEKEQN